MFVSVEGLDGTGKTTLCNELVKRMPEFTYERTPGQIPGIRDMLLGAVEYRPFVDMLLFLGDHLQLDTSKNYVVDRFIDSTFVYQVISNPNLTPHQEAIIFEFVVNFFTFPDMTIILDCDKATAMDRLNCRGVENKFDAIAEEKYEKIRDAYLSLLDIFPHRTFKVIDVSNMTKEEVADAVETAIQDEISYNVN